MRKKRKESLIKISWLLKSTHSKLRKKQENQRKTKKLTLNKLKVKEIELKLLLHLSRIKSFTVLPQAKVKMLNYLDSKEKKNTIQEKENSEEVVVTEAAEAAEETEAAEAAVVTEVIEEPEEVEKVLAKVVIDKTKVNNKH